MGATLQEGKEPEMMYHATRTQHSCPPEQQEAAYLHRRWMINLDLFLFLSSRSHAVVTGGGKFTELHTATKNKSMYPKSLC